MLYSYNLHVFASWFCPNVNNTYMSMLFLHFLMFSLIFMNMQMSYDNYIYIKTIYLTEHPTFPFCTALTCVPLSLKLLKILRVFVFLDFCDSSSTRCYGNGIYYRYTYGWNFFRPNDDLIQSRYNLKYFIATTCKFLHLGSVQMLTIHTCIWFKYVFLQFLCSH